MNGSTGAEKPSTKWDAPPGWSMRDDVLSGLAFLREQAAHPQKTVLIVPEWAGDIVKHGMQALYDRKMIHSRTPIQWLRNLWWGIKAAWVSGFWGYEHFSAGTLGLKPFDDGDAIVYHGRISVQFGKECAR